MNLFLCSCGSKTIKHSPGDTWVIQLSDEFSLECRFDEINSKQLILTLSKVNKDDLYNFAIKSNISNDNIYISDLYVNNEQVEMKTTGIIPTSYYEINPFNETNKIIIQFNREIDVFRKIDIKTDNTFWGSEDKDFLGIRIFLYTD